MLRMLRFEFQKIFSYTTVIGSMVVLLLINFILLQAYCFNNSSTTVCLPDGKQLSGREAILYNQSVAEKYAGDYTDKKISEMAADFSKEYPNDYNALASGEAVNLSAPSTYLYLTMFIPPQNYDEIAQDAIRQGSSIPPLTEYRLISLRDYNAAFIDKPLQYGYNDSWAYFFMGFCGSTLTMAIPTLIVIIIAVSMIFSNEYNLKTDALILTTKYGKNRQIIAKLLASLLFATFLVVGVFILFAIGFVVQFGFIGWNADIQTNLGLSLLSVEIPFNNLQLTLFAFFIVWLASIFTASLTAMLSAITKTPFSSLAIALALFVVPRIVRQILIEGPVRDMLMVFPINAVNVQEVLRLPTYISSIFYGHPYGPAICIGIATIIVFVVSSTIAYYTFKNHQAI